MGESRTPRPRTFAGDHYERVRCFVVDRPDGHRQPAGRSSHVPLRALTPVTRRWPGSHLPSMTLPQPREVRLLPRSLYDRLRGESESRLAVASYFVWAPFCEAWSPTSARVLR